MTDTLHTLESCQALDAADALAPLRDLFDLPAGMVYLDGNSLGAMPRATAARVADAVTREWGRDLIQSWNTAGWFGRPLKVGDQIVPLIGARAGEVVAADTTSINLHKVLATALHLAQQRDPARKAIVSERSNFPTDLYMAEGLLHTRGGKEKGCDLRLVDSNADAIVAALKPDVAVLMLTHVNYRTGAMHDMAALTAAAHRAGVLVVWDLAHSAGAVPVDLNGAGADFAIGCGYKYLNGGPGAPAFAWVNAKHIATLDADTANEDDPNRFAQPLSGWWAHGSPFAFSPRFAPAPGITRYQCGTQPILSLTALQAGLDAFAEAEKSGGMAALRRKSLALTDLFIALVAQRCPGRFDVVTPLDHAQRGSQVSLAVAGQTRKVDPADKTAYAIVQALIARGVVGDYRAGGSADAPDEPHLLRFGFTPLYVGFEDVWRAVDALVQVLAHEEHRQPRFQQTHAVT